MEGRHLDKRESSWLSNSVQVEARFYSERGQPFILCNIRRRNKNLLSQGENEPEHCSISIASRTVGILT